MLICEEPHVGVAKDPYPRISPFHRGGGLFDLRTAPDEVDGPSPVAHAGEERGGEHSAGYLLHEGAPKDMRGRDDTGACRQHHLRPVHGEAQASVVPCGEDRLIVGREHIRAAARVHDANGVFDSLNDVDIIKLYA